MKKDVYKRQVALYGIGVVGILNQKFIAQALQFSLRKGPACRKRRLQRVHFPKTSSRLAMLHPATSSILFFLTIIAQIRFLCNAAAPNLLCTFPKPLRIR